MRKAMNKEQQFAQLHDELQSCINAPDNAITNDDLQRVAQVFVDEYGDDLLVPDEIIQTLILIMCEKLTHTEKEIFITSVMDHETVAADMDRAISWIKEATDNFSRLAVQKMLGELNPEHLNILEELDGNIDEMIEKVTSTLKNEMGEQSYNSMFSLFGKAKHDPELNRLLAGAFGEQASMLNKSDLNL